MKKLKIFFKNHTPVKKLNQHANSESDSSGLESNHCTNGPSRRGLRRGWVRGEKRKSRHSGCKGFESQPRVDRKFSTHGYLREAFDNGAKNQI